jgi:hypothetical protein
MASIESAINFSRGGRLRLSASGRRQVELRHGPLLGQSVASLDLERRLIGGNGLVQQFCTFGAAGIERLSDQGDAQIVLCVRPVHREPLSGANFERRSVGGHGLFQ